MGYVIKTCILDTKCDECEHCRPDPERYGDRSCFLNEDLKGKERLEYLLKLRDILEERERRKGETK